MPAAVMVASGPSAAALSPLGWPTEVPGRKDRQTRSRKQVRATAWVLACAGGALGPTRNDQKSLGRQSKS